MKRTQFTRIWGMLSAAAALLLVSCNEASIPTHSVTGAVAFDVQPGPPVLDQKNGTLGFTGSDIRKGFNPHNPQLGDAIIATFIWSGSTNVITSVHDELTNGTQVGNTYNLVEYKTAGGISMATYVALNVQNFPQGNPSDPNPDQNIILVVIGTLSAPITNGGIMLSAFKGVATTAALTGHASAGGTSPGTTTQASTGPITPGDGSLLYSVSFSSPNAAHDPPPGTSNITNLSTGDGTVKIVGQWAVHSGVGTADPQWTWFHTQPSSWLLTNLALLANGAPPPPTTGNLTATTSTTGSNQDPDGYTVTLDGGASQAISNNGSVTFTGLSAGDHSVALSGVAANCTVGGSNPRTVTVPSGGTASTAFSIDCHVVQTTGNLSVSASTAGSDLDPDGYTATVDGSTSQAVGINGSVTFSNLPQGNHSVALSGVASNCSVTNANPQTVSVPAGGTGSASFTVSCTAIPPATGNLNASASTTGSDQDPDGYTVTVDGGSSQQVGINGTVTFTGLSQGNHSVALSGVASNCSVINGNPQTASVPGGGTASVSFTVDCSPIPPSTGDLNVSASTSGSDLDPNGYTATVDGSSSLSVATNGSVTFSGLSQGNHSVALSGVASNCSVTSSNPQTVSVPAGGTGSASFSVSCAALAGNLKVIASTTGSSLDPNGYTVTVDGGSSLGVATNGSVTFPSLSPGNHTVALSGVASNCTVSGSNPRTVSVTAGTTVNTTFSVTCVTPNTPPVVNAGPDETILASILWAENWSFTDPDNGPWSFTIDWGDGTTSSGTKTAPGSFSNSHAYGTLLLGTHTIRITVTDSQGGTHSDTKVVRVVLF